MVLNGGKVEMNENKKKVLCNFKGVSDESKKYFLDALDCEELYVYSEDSQENCDSDMICTFSCLDNYIRCLSGQKSLYIPKPATKGIRIETLLDDQDCIWCTGYGMYANSLIKIDKVTMKVEILPMPYETINKERLFVDILRVENTIYLVPENSKFIGIFNIVDGIWKKIDIADETTDGWYYSTAVAVDGHVYFFPYKAKNILKINCKNYEKQIIPIKLAKEIIMHNEQYPFCSLKSSLVIDKNIYFYSRRYNSFMRFDVEKKRIDLIRKLEDKDLSLACVTDGNMFWMFTTSGDNKIVKYDIKKDEINYFNKIPKIEYNDVPFYKGIKSENKIIFVPGLAEKAIVFDIDTSEMNILEKLKNESYEKTKENWIYSCIDGDEENIYLFETKINKLIKYNIEKNTVEKKELHVLEKEWYEGQAKKVMQMVLQDIEPPVILGGDIIEEY